MKQPEKARTDPKAATNMCEWCARNRAVTTAMMPVHGRPVRLNICTSCKREGS